MRDIQEMFLKAANFRIIEKPPLGGDPFTTIGYRMKNKGNEYGSYIRCYGLLRDPERTECEELLKEEALESLLMLVGCHA